MPAEWERHHATWIGWPHNKSDWPGRFGPIPWAYAEIVRKLTPAEVVRILVNSPVHERAARRALTSAGVSPDRAEFFRFPTNRGWTRDFGPLFVRRSGRSAQLGIARFRFNAWAKYPDWKKDDRIPERVAARLDLPLFPARAGSGGRDVVLEGGSIDVNGRGSLLTTEECLLDPAVQVRNPGLALAELEGALRDYLGATNVLCLETNPNDPNYRPLHENRERLDTMRLEDGSKVDVVELPMPAPLYCDGQRLPASYANFYIGNAAVLVPTFNDRNDRIALGILADLIEDRPVIGIHAVDLVWGLGTIHCLTQQEPAVNP